MRHSELHPEIARGPIAFMARHNVAANLLMFGILAAGLVALGTLERQAWPVVPFNTIEVSVIYPGATPNEIEESIITKIEEQVEGLQIVKTIKSLAAPGVASVRAELVSNADLNEAMDDIQSAVARITSFPGASESPQFREMDNRTSLIRLLLYGDVPERSLKALAYQIEDELDSLPAVSQVVTTGARDYEYSVEVPLTRLRALGLTLDDIAHAIRRNSLDLPAGSIETSRSEVRVRTVGQNYSRADFEDIIVIAHTDGTAVRLGDIAEVHDGLEDSNLILRHQGQAAIFVEVIRAEGEQVMEVATAVQDHVADVIAPTLPAGVGITFWNDESLTYQERVGLLVRNGLLGLILVFIALALFLEIRLALWVVLGLVTAGVGALVVMQAFEFSINTVSLFCFVLAIGIIVDDAIVVSEHIYLERMSGAPGLVAAVRGARRVKKPLTFAVLTSVAAFVPLLFIPGGIGEVWAALPVIVIGMLFISLVESLFILPRHLSHLNGPDWAPRNVLDKALLYTRQTSDRWLKKFVNGPLNRAVRFSTGYPAIVVGGVIGLFIISMSLVPAGIVATDFAGVIEGDFVTATLEMPDGTPAERTLAVAMDLEMAGRRVLDRLDQTRPADAPSLLSGVTVTVGQGPHIEGGGLSPSPTTNLKGNLAAIELKLLSAQQRSMSTIDIMQAWREEVGELPHVRGIEFSGEAFTLGSPVEAVLSHPNPDRLIQMAESVLGGLRSIAGVFDVRSDHAPGVDEIQLELKPEARTLGLAVEDVGRQIRAAIFGVEAVRLQRDREEVRVYARLPVQEREAITDVEGYLIRTPTGAEVPLSQVASISMGTSAPIVRRQDGQRVVTITADVDAGTISAGQANEVFENDILAPLVNANPGFEYSFGGEQQQQLDSLDALYRGFVLALLAIFALLAIPLKSYTKPLVVMAIIPFGLIGVVLGHLILGVPLGGASLLGFFGLSGVVVNDSLVMIEFINQRLRDGAPVRTAIIEGAKGRFRPIMLTSVTTFLAFTPLILEPSNQAQYLVPFAASLGVGIMISTAILLLLVPALMTVTLRKVHQAETAPSA